MRSSKIDENILRESSQGFGRDCLELEKINQTLMEMLTCFAKSMGENDVAERLDGISGSGPDWYKNWLEDFPWVRELFFRYFLVGERAIAEAECFLLGDGSSYERMFESAMVHCIAHVRDHVPSGMKTNAIQAVEAILDNFGKRVNADGYSVEEKNRDHVPLRVVQRYAVGADREDLLKKLGEAVDQYFGRCKDANVEDLDFKGSVLNLLTRQKSIYHAAYPKLKGLPGGYQEVADKKRIDEIPVDFERNLAMIACADASARFEIEKRFREKFANAEGECRDMVEVLSGNPTARETDSVFRKNASLPGEIASRIVCHRLLLWLLREWVRKSTYAANYNMQGSAHPVEAGGRESRTWGHVEADADQVHHYLDWFAESVVMKLRGWGDTRISGDDVDYDKVLLQWVTSKTDEFGRYRTNIPLVRFLEGGLTFKNLKEVLDNYTRNLLVKDVSGRVLDSLDRKVGEGDKDGEKKKIIDMVEAPTVEDRTGEIAEMQKKIYEMLVSYDRKLAVYFWLVRFGARHFSRQDVGKGVICEEGWKILEGKAEGEKVPIGDALRIIGMNPNNTNWFRRNMEDFVKGNPEKIRALLVDGDDAVRFMKQFN